MKKKIIYLILLFSSIGFAQKDIVFSGGNGSGPGGSVSFTFGQIAVTEISGTNGKMSQGVQQPIEIYTLSSEQFMLDYQIGLFPNPAIHSITLTLDKYEELNQITYLMFDVTGKLVRNGKLTNNETIINVSDLASATYFLNMLDGGKLIKTFKIIKNN
ncbi:T9SS type A sorting domain-containing protein [Flavobacterium difficile]|uniref:T9SS type A sorting domain-containing protein n=1 Tax=Flavobacterium difficile TaxID=2709659 RepID=A0ABX0I4W6_9FLAO|nr:T9SS type A sorting domain-containing protein [Flavobacterium difficile]NHM00595.1 T9SS type A sorting domain-containing protein [Flavobacterium difficile]